MMKKTISGRIRDLPKEAREFIGFCKEDHTYNQEHGRSFFLSHIDKIDVALEVAFILRQLGLDCEHFIPTDTVIQREQSFGEVSMFTKPYKNKNTKIKRKKLLFSGGDLDCEYLEGDDERRLLLLAWLGNNEARNMLVSSNVRVVVKAARDYWRSNLHEDMIQEGTLSILNAIKKFDPSFKTRLSTYSFDIILQSVRALRADLNKGIEVPPHLQHRAEEYLNASFELLQKNKREPTSAEIQEKLGRPDNLFIRTVGIVTEVPKNRIGIEDRNIMPLVEFEDKKNHPRDYSSKEFVKQKIDLFIKKLSRNERIIIQMRYGINGPKLTLEQVGEENQLTRERVRQIESKVVDKIKEDSELCHLIEMLQEDED